MTIPYLITEQVFVMGNALDLYSEAPGS